MPAQPTVTVLAFSILASDGKESVGVATPTAVKVRPKKPNVTARAQLRPMVGQTCVGTGAMAAGTATLSTE